nr:restriction endonuclease subunit S [Anaerococcus tetradius]
MEWGEYRIGDLFDGESGDFDIQKDHINDLGEYVITAGLTNNGVLGKSDVNAKIIDRNTITVDMFGYSFFRQFKYKIVTHARVFALIPKFEISRNIGVSITSALSYLPSLFGYQNMCSWNKIKDLKIKLPSKNGKINYEFMESFVAELEAQRVAELEAYLNVTGLKDYKLNDEEINAIYNLEKVEWHEFKMGDLFERIKTKKLPYKAKELPKEPKDNYILPLLTSSFMNQGLNYYAPETNATVLKNVISIPSNSDVYRSYYQSREFSVLSDAYAIEWKNKEIELSPNGYLFSVSCINKVTDLPIYSYKNKLGGWNVVKNKYIKLPVDSNGEIDFNYMENLTQAIKKLVIKDLVIYTDRKIEVTKKVINKK